MWAVGLMTRAPIRRVVLMTKCSQRRTPCGKIKILFCKHGNLVFSISRHQYQGMCTFICIFRWTCTHSFLMNMYEAKMWVAGPKAVVFAGIKKLFGSAISKAHNSSSLLTPQCLSSPAIHAFTPQRAMTRYHSPPLSSAVRSTKPQENCCSFLQPDHFYFAQILK